MELIFILLFIDSVTSEQDDAPCIEGDKIFAEEQGTIGQEELFMDLNKFEIK